jgi:hypothetical protein
MKARGLRSPDYADALALAVGIPLRLRGENGQAITNKADGLQSVSRFKGINTKRLRSRR